MSPRNSDDSGYDEPPGDHLPCPRCRSRNTIRLVSIHHCNTCSQPFTPFEVELTARIHKLEKIIERLNENVRLKKGA